MIIQYLGHSSFLLESEGTRVVTDPFGDVGIPFPRLSADAVTVSHGHYDHNNTAAVKAAAVFDRAGRYSVGKMAISATESFHDDRGGKLRGRNLIFRFEAEGVTVCHLGDLGERLSDELLERIGRPDVLLLPVGGHYTIDAAEAAALVRAVRPSVTVPMHYAVPGLTVDIAGVEDFLAEFPEAEESGPQLVFTASDRSERTKVLVLRRK